LAWVKITQNEVEKFSDLFKAINVSNSGFLTPAELKQGLETKSEDFSLKSEDWENVIESVQTNYDGNVGYNEFILACSQYTTNLNAKQIQELFTQIDSDNDGYLDMEEMKGFFREENYGESGASTTPEAQIWEQIMTELTKDGTRKVDYDEFHQAMASVIQRGVIDPDTVFRNVGLRESVVEHL
jgi:Ca2+-binding EF-hand superfamily protein